MKNKKLILTALILSGSLGLGWQSVSAQTAPSTGTQKRGIPGVMPSQPKASGSAHAARLSSDQIKQVKEALKAKGLHPGPINGTMDSQTQQALKQFQKANNLPVTGTVDEKTASKLGLILSEPSGASSGYSGSRVPGRSPSTAK
jgi:peptidoglycan hydrolase-like protein with peptidoglycan-binding domain